MNNTTNKRVLILTEASLDDRITLAVIRSLAKAGYEVSVASYSFRGRAFHSRHIRERIPIPDHVSDLPGFKNRLHELIDSREFATVLPTSDHLTISLSKLKSELSISDKLPVPDAAAASIAKDKHRTGELAASLGLSIPRTVLLADRQSLEQSMAKLVFPCVLKPRSSVSSIGMSIAATPEALLEAFDSLPDAGNATFDFRQPLLQEKIEGNVHEVCALFHRGKARVALTQKRLLMHPGTGGPGIYNETTDEPDLKEAAFKLLEALNWHGPAQVEFIRDLKSGKPYFLEINGRYWGTLDLSIAAGMDFPSLACRMAIDGDVEPQWKYRIGQRFRWPFPFALLYAMESGHWLGSFRDFILPRRSTSSDLSLSDPKPLFMELLYTLNRVTRRRFKTMRSEQDWSEIVSGDNDPGS